MNCPLQSENTLDLLLDYSAGRLDRPRAALLERHMEDCAGCAAFRAQQSALWNVLDSWEPAPISLGFNRSLRHKIEAADAAPWYRRAVDALRFGAWKPAFPVAAAAMVIAAGFMFDHRQAPMPQVAAGVSISDAEQVEKTLDDIQLLRQFDAASASGAANAM